MSDDPALESVRAELRGLGYLDDTVERYLLQDALRPAPPGWTLWRMTAKVALLLGLPAAALGAVALGAVNGHLRVAPLDLLPLFAHLALPTVPATGAAFALLAGALVVLLRVTHARRIEAVSFAVGLLAAVAALLLALDALRALARAGGLTGSVPLDGESTTPLWAIGLAAVLLPLLAWIVFKVVHGGLLTLAILLTDQTPERPSGDGRRLLAALGGAVVTIGVLAALDVGRPDAAVPSTLPIAGDAGAVLLLGVDGVLAHEVDFLLATDALPALAALLDDGAAVVPIERAPGPPASLWASAATGVEPARHGIESVDAYLPLGMKRPLGGDGWLGRWWSLLAPTPLVAHRPVLAASRRAHAVWELAGRGGTPVVSVGWWGTFPVEPQAGVVVAHGALQLLADAEPSEADDVAGVVHPAALVDELRAAAAEARLPAELDAGIRVAFGAEAAAEVERKALRPDVAYAEIFRRSVDRASPRVAALYLAGLDVAAGLVPADRLRGAVAGSLARRQLQAVDALVGDLGDRFETVLVAVDPGRRGGDGAREGRLLVWRRGVACDRASAGGVTVGAVAAAALRTAGLPQSREVPPPPAACPWPAPPATVDGFGPRRHAAPADGGDEYLEQLQSLGYL